MGSSARKFVDPGFSWYFGGWSVCFVLEGTVKRDDVFGMFDKVRMIYVKFAEINLGLKKIRINTSISTKLNVDPPTQRVYLDMCQNQ
jgi:hypothetical protein